MSHLVNAPLKIKSISDLEKAVKVFGCTLEKATRFTSYQGEHNQCEYRIAVPGARWHIGVVKQKEGQYALSWDSFGGQGRMHADKFGANLGELSKEYTAQVCMTQARKKIGWTVMRKRLPNGKLQLRMVHA